MPDGMPCPGWPAGGNASGGENGLNQKGLSHERPPAPAGGQAPCGAGELEEHWVTSDAVSRVGLTYGGGSTAAVRVLFMTSPHLGNVERVNDDVGAGGLHMPLRADLNGYRMGTIG